MATHHRGAHAWSVLDVQGVTADASPDQESREGSGPAQPDNPRFSVCVATRNSGAGIIPTLLSMRDLDHDSFEVIVVDQSTDKRTERAYRQPVGADQRFSYFASDTVGRTAACNLATTRAVGVNLAFTDDDCLVPRDWLAGMERALDRHPEVGMVCGGIRGVPHDESRNYTVDFIPRRAQVHRSPWLAFRAVGIGGGNLVLRSQVLRDVGGFDEVLGVGAPLRAFEEVDLVYRLLRIGQRTLELPEPSVLHCELKPWDTAGRQLVANYAFGEGALMIKHLRMGELAALPLLVPPLVRVRWRNVVRLRRPNGLLSLAAFIRGACAGFGFAIDRRSRRYVPRHDSRPRAAASDHS